MIIQKKTNLYTKGGLFFCICPLHTKFFFLSFAKIHFNRGLIMATAMRLSRFGKRHAPIYRVVIIDNRKARDDSFIEQVGFYNPNTKKAEIKFEQEKVLKWLQCGAQPSDTVRNLLKQSGILDLFHELKAKRSIEGKTATPRPEKNKKKQLGPKALARLEAEKAAKEAPAEEAPAAEATEA